MNNIKVTRSRAVGLLIGFFLFSMPTTSLGNEVTRYAKTLFEHLTGVPLLEIDPRFTQMTEAIRAGQLDRAAQIATADSNFYAVTVKNFAAPLTNIDESPLVPFNDMQATIMGVIRDDLDARTLLTGNFYYRGFSDLSLPDVEIDSNRHYQEFENRGYDFKRNLTRVDNQWADIPEYAGVLTSRAWAEAHLKAGTNRRAVQYTFQAFLCAPISQWKDRGISDHRVRRDVDRAPGGDPSTYQNHCRNCHSVMDGLTGAFAKFDFVDSRISYSAPHRVADKMNQNGNVYPEGYVTYDNQWINQALYNHNEGYFGWRGATSGYGVQEFGVMVANSRAFSRCMTKKAFEEVCRRSPEGDEDRAAIEQISQAFEEGGYRLRQVFERVAINNRCLQQPNSGSSFQ